MLRKLLLRVYGPQAGHLIDREKELEILKRLARKKIGPRLLGTFMNGRFEQFFNANPLTPKDFRDPEISKQIAKRMRELHDGIDLLDEERTAGPLVWQNWDKWVKRCEEVICWLDNQILAYDGSLLSKSDSWKSRGLVCGVPWSSFRQAVDNYRIWLKKQYGGGQALRDKLVFAHNDVRTYSLHLSPNLAKMS
jgi:choline kinase